MASLADAGTAAAVQEQVERLYGGALPDVDGVVHVAAVYDEAGMLFVLRIREETPKSDEDFFALNLARARADAIVVTGKVLRDEPQLRYALQGPGRLPAGLLNWRRQVAGRTQPPLLAVLTSGRGLSLDHPAFHGWARPLVITSEAAAERLATGSVPVKGLVEPSLSGVLSELRDRGCRTVSIEAGPSTARALYEPPVRVAELMLSTYDGQVPEPVRGPSLISRADLEARLPRCTEPARFGAWTFERRWVAP